MPTTSRAALLRRPSNARPFATASPVEIVEVELADPGPGEILIRIDAAGLCHSDLSAVQGVRPWPMPLVLGHEATGMVESTGGFTPGVNLGDRVVLVFVPSCGRCPECQSGTPARCPSAAAANRAGKLISGERRLSLDGEALHHHLGISGFAQHAVVDARSAVVVPRDTPPQIAALCGCASLTGVGAVLSAGALRAGESAVVFGLGGVGLAAVLGAAAMGAFPLVAVDPSEAKRSLARELGATHSFDPDDTESIRKATRGGGDVVIEAVGRAAVIEAALAVAGNGARVVTVGLPDPSEVARVSAAALVGRGISLIGSYLGNSAPQRDVPRFVEMWRAGRFPVDRLVSDSIPLEDINEAFDSLADGRATRIMIDPWAQSLHS